MKKIIYYSLIIIILSFPGNAQDSRKIELTATSILAQVDQILRFPDGLIDGRLKHIFPNGKSYKIDIKISKIKDNFLFVYSNRKRGDQIKVLYNLAGEDIWVYDIHSIRLYHKLGIDKYDAILSSNFSFIDMSTLNLQSNYTATIKGFALIKGKDAIKLQLIPIFRGSMYGRLTLYVTKDEYIPLRIDFHDRDNAIYKFMTISRIKREGNKIVPFRYDMMDIRKGSVSIINFHNFNSRVNFQKRIFRSENLGE